ncbi:DUF3299 domain-containing protein [Stutzerimonas azotifigens]|uniref:DUF3299 domain-containing protein n=1 Tax=Stutzerimonas azotifigens TaxID=291995 RepID=UPI0004136DB1|nr:DUF3299 domain-containing protein [Stutzerimonas azotifigens]
MRSSFAAFALCAACLAASFTTLAEPRELQWHELVPADAPPPEPPVALHDLSQLADVLAAESGPAAQQQSPAAPVVPELDGQEVRLPGYVVPLEMLDDGRVVEFLLVPYFGACIHVPPPPSNQIVHVRTDQAFQLEALWQPFWAEGRLRVEQVSSDLAEAGYRMQAERIYPYELSGG